MIIETDAIVLHRMNYKNNSLIARLFTKNSGKISVIVNGASKKKGNLFGVIEPPNIIHINYYKRKEGGLQTCKEANFLSNNLSIKKNINTLTISLAIVDIVDKTIHENDINRNIYELIDKSLHALNNGSINPKIILIYFLIKLINHLGFMPRLNESQNMNITINQELQSILLQFINKDFQSLNNIIINENKFLEIIIFLENYIIEHLKLNKKIKSLKIIKDMKNG